MKAVSVSRRSLERSRISRPRKRAASTVKCGDSSMYRSLPRSIGVLPHPVRISQASPGRTSALGRARSRSSAVIPSPAAFGKSSTAVARMTSSDASTSCSRRCFRKVLNCDGRRIDVPESVPTVVPFSGWPRGAKRKCVVVGNNSSGIHSRSRGIVSSNSEVTLCTLRNSFGGGLGRGGVFHGGPPKRLPRRGPSAELELAT